MRRIRVIGLVFLIANAACLTREVSQLEPTPEREELTEIPVDLNRDLDILFVIDNSGSMELEQTSLRDNFPRIIEALDLDGIGLPSLHIGVITTDIGAGVACPGSGDDGNLVGTSSCPVTGAFIKDLANEDGTRTTNYTGTLAEAFSCVADVGADGCGFEQPLEAVRRALDNNPQNQGFLRDHAYLAVVVVTDEDDCSARDDGLFDTTPVDLSSALGPPLSFRCFEFGIECEGGADLREPGTKENCVPQSDSPYLHGIEQYTEFLRGLKPFQRQILLATISGSLDSVSVIHTDDSRFSFQVAELVKSCQTAAGAAVPPIRLQTALDNVGVPVQQTSICEGDLTEAVSQIADFFARQLSPCMSGDLLDTDPATPELDPECTVTEISFDTNGTKIERALPECDNPGDPEASSSLPCYTLSPTPQCADDPASPSGLLLEVHYADGVTVPPLTSAKAACYGI